MPAFGIFRTRDGALLSAPEETSCFVTLQQAQQYVGMKTGIYAEQLCPLHLNAEKVGCRFCSRELDHAVSEMLAGIADGFPIGAGIHARTAAHFAASLLDS